MNKNLQYNIPNLSFCELVSLISKTSSDLGGGGISSLVGIFGLSLVEKAKNITNTRLLKKDKSNASIHIDFSTSINRLKEISILDGQSFEEVLQAFKMPKETDEQIKLRKEKIKNGYKNATNLPFEVGSILLEELNNISKICSYFDKIAISDVISGIRLLDTAIQMAMDSANINIIHTVKEVREQLTEKMNDIICKSRNISDVIIEQTSCILNTK